MPCAKLTKRFQTLRSMIPLCRTAVTTCLHMSWLDIAIIVIELRIDIKLTKTHILTLHDGSTDDALMLLRGVTPRQCSTSAPWLQTNTVSVRLKQHLSDLFISMISGNMLNKHRELSLGVAAYCSPKTGAPVKQYDNDPNAGAGLPQVTAA